jgi:hypothetical protein
MLKWSFTYPLPYILRASTPVRCFDVAKLDFCKKIKTFGKLEAPIYNKVKKYPNIKNIFDLDFYFVQ